MNDNSRSIQSLSQRASVLMKDVESSNSEDSAIKLLLLYLNSSLSDWELAIEYSKKYHERFPDNGMIFLLHVFAEYWRGKIEDSNLDKILNNNYPSDIKNLLYLVAVLHFEFRDSDRAIFFAKYIEDHNYDFVYLFRFFLKYYKQNDNKYLCNINKKRLINGINYIFRMEDELNPEDLKYFINERIKGTWLSKPNLVFVLEDLIE